MNRRWIFGLVTAALLMNLAIGAQIYLSSPKLAHGTDAAAPNLQLIADVLTKIRTQYVDGTNLTYRSLTYAALNGMVAKLDPHSEFLDPGAYQQLQDDTEGQFGGLGLVVVAKDGFVTVVAPMDDTPGSRAGIISGDRMIKVGTNSVFGMPLEDVVNELRGEPGTSVALTIERPSTGTTKQYALTRAVVQMDMVKDIAGHKEFPLGTNQIGYVRIVEFGDQTSDELEDALTRLEGQGMKALVIDLRGNPGGLLDEAVGVCQKFLPANQLIVSTEGRESVEKYFARGNGDELKGMPIVVLVNLDSASASEIVTGCLQDLHRAYVIGEKTFGKGSVQTIFPLDDGSALKLTVAKYYTPSHKVIHEHGITPDSIVPVTDFEDWALALQHTLGGVDSLPANQQAKVMAVTDVQLERADDLLTALLLQDARTAANHPQRVAAR
ncbi:MAG TPA: S41 family peptidase [Candidatus Angelobacter sp.]|nr:S41 family peptidase [Candidatus Angelobacter sp.]